MKLKRVEKMLKRKSRWTVLVFRVAFAGNADDDTNLSKRPLEVLSELDFFYYNPDQIQTSPIQSVDEYNPRTTLGSFAYEIWTRVGAWPLSRHDSAGDWDTAILPWNHGAQPRYGVLDEVT